MYEHTPDYYKACVLRYSYSIPQLQAQLNEAQIKCNTQAEIVKRTRGKNKKAWEQLMLEYDEAVLRRIEDALAQERECPIINCAKIIVFAKLKMELLNSNKRFFSYPKSDRFCREGEAGDNAKAWFLAVNNTQEELESRIAHLQEKTIELIKRYEEWGGEDFHEYHVARVDLRISTLARKLDRLKDVRMPNYEQSPFNNILCSLDRKTPTNATSHFMYGIDVSIDSLKVGDDVHIGCYGIASRIIKIMPKTIRFSEFDVDGKKTGECTIKKSKLLATDNVIKSTDQPYEKEGRIIYHLITE